MLAKWPCRYQLILGVMAPETPTRARGTEKLSGGSPSSLPGPAMVVPALSLKIASAWMEAEFVMWPTVTGGGVTSWAAASAAEAQAASARQSTSGTGGMTRGGGEVIRTRASTS